MFPRTCVAGIIRRFKKGIRLGRRIDPFSTKVRRFVCESEAVSDDRIHIAFYQTQTGYEPFLPGAGTSRIPLVARTITPHIKPSCLIVEVGTPERARFTTSRDLCGKRAPLLRGADSGPHVFLIPETKIRYYGEFRCIFVP